MRSLRFPLLASSLVIIAACGGKVFVDPGIGNGGAGGAGGSTNTGTTQMVCGGKQGLQCPADMWCAWDQPGSCGNADGTGTCQPRPQGCTGDCQGVCGCDGQMYCNDCSANAAGVDTSNDLSCELVDAGSGGPEYSARMLATNLPRYVIFKTDKSLDRCVRVTVAMTGSGQYPNIQTTMGWSVETAEVTAHASDCALGANGFPIMTMQTAEASDGGGNVKQDSSSFPQVVSIHVKLSFPAGAPWVPPGDTLDADNLQIIQGPLGGP